MLALGRLKTGQMNKTEAAYAEHLRALVWFARVTGMEPDWQRVEWWIRRGLVVRVVRRGRGRA